MDLLNNFGFEPLLFIAQIVNFLILAYILKRFLYKPVLSLMAKRRSTIEQGLEDAQKAAQDREKAQKERDLILKEASNEAKDILEQTRSAADEMKNKIIENARHEADKIIAVAQDEAKLEFEKMQKQVQKVSLELSAKILENIAGSLFTDDEKDKIVARGIKKIRSM